MYCYGSCAVKFSEIRLEKPFVVVYGSSCMASINSFVLCLQLHFIFQHKNPINGTFEEKHAKKPKGNFQGVFDGKKTHLFTLIIRPDNTFEVLVDQESVNKGSLLEDMTPPVNPPKEIEDPDDQKPEDWDEREKIPDPDADKPEDWDEDAPQKIPDESAKVCKIQCLSKIQMQVLVGQDSTTGAQTKYKKKNEMKEGKITET